MKRTLTFFTLVLAMLTGMAQTSPNGKIRVKPGNGHDLVVEYKSQVGWQHIFTLQTNCITPTGSQKGKLSYTMLLGKKANCQNAYVMSTYTNGAGHDLQVKVYNDGVAWIQVGSSTVDFTSATHDWIQKWSDSYEDFFPRDRELPQDMRCSYPALFEYAGGTFALLSESCLTREMAASSMYAQQKRGMFSIRPDGSEQGGWQTCIIGSLNDLVQSTLITDNSEPCRLQATSWIQPGVAAWVYWAYNHGSNDCKIIKQYTDMAAALHLPYVLIDAEWDEMKDGKTVEDAVKYALDKGIKPIIWYSSSVGWIHGAPGPKFRLNKPEDREKEFAWCEKIGVKGVKIDFFSGDTNMNIAYMIDLLESAARHHLLVNFHGATIPRGWQRTYPNLVSTEAVYGAEWYNNRPTMTQAAPAHNATLPFTRNIIGSMDYTPCAFTDSQHPHLTTNAHELALTALFESGIQHLADRPESFLAQPQDVQDYLGKLPTAWDETHLLAGYPGQGVVMARRKGSVWYIAGINGLDIDQRLSFSLKGLRKVAKHGTLFADGPTQTSFDISTYNLRNKNITIPCKPRGGFVLVLGE